MKRIMPKKSKNPDSERDPDRIKSLEEFRRLWPIQRKLWLAEMRRIQDEEIEYDLR